MLVGFSLKNLSNNSDCNPIRERSSQRQAHQQELPVVQKRSKK
jgi:hypothetical protein